jgi:hypothetical protein
MKQSQVGSVRRLKWKPSMNNIPVVRAISKNGYLSRSKGMTYDSFLKHYHDLLGRAGFLSHSTPYAIRRGTANAIEGSGIPA